MAGENNPSFLQQGTNDEKRARVNEAGEVFIEVSSKHIDFLTKAINVLDWEHHMVHKGKTFSISHRAAAVANDGFLDIHLTGVTNDAHLKVTYSCEGKALFNTYIGTTYTNLGTTLVPWNRCICSSEIATTLVRIGPTINVLGTKRVDEFIGSAGAAVTRAGGVGGSNIETILNPGYDLLLRLQNKSGSASDLQMTINFYELPPET